MYITGLTDSDVQDMLDGKVSNYLLREGLCGRDISQWDLSDLSLEFFKKLCFDSNTKFSEEQMQKFNPKELLEKAKKPSQDICRLHSQGITGQGLTLAVIDTNIDREHEIFSNGNIHMKSSNNMGEVEPHGLTVVSALTQIVPDSQIDYYPYDKTNKNNDNIREELIDKIIESGVKIISMSSSFNSEEIRKRVLEKCEKAGVTLIDQPAFVKHFTFCFRDIDENGEEHFEEAFMEPETASLPKAKWEEYQSLLGKYGVEDRKALSEKIKLDSNIKEEVKPIILKRLENFGELFDCKSYEGEGGVTNISKQKIIQEERERKNVSRAEKPIEIHCGGRSFASPDGYKYWGSCSNSYTIPQIVGIFALARQISPNLSFEQFSKIANQTSMQIASDGYDRLVISPENLIEQIKQLEELKKIKLFHDQKSDETFQIIKTGLHTITKADVIRIAKKDEVVMEKEKAMEVRAREERDMESELKQNNFSNLE